MGVRLSAFRPHLAEFPEAVWASVKGLDVEQIDKITHRNAMSLFSFDPFSVRPREECTVGALRREVEGHDVSLVSRGRPQDHATTMGDFMSAVRR